MKRLARTSRAFLPAISAAVLVGGCSSDPTSGTITPAADAEPNAGQSQYSVKVYFDTPDGLVRSEFRPNPPGGKAQAEQQTKQAQAVIGVPDGDGTKTFELPAGLSSYLLVMGAAVECGITDTINGVADVFDTTLATWPWAAGAYYVFKDRYSASGPNFNSCDDVLFHEEVTMCMAGKLNDIATAVGPIVWKNLAHLPKANPSDPDPPWKTPWILPPQRTADKFLIRNFAINALAHVARIDQEKPQGLTVASCTEAYASAAAGIYTDADAPLLFGKAANQTAPYFLPWGDGDANDSPPITSVTAPLMAARRLEHRARILRNAGQLLQEQINKGVYADLAGASKLKGMAGDEAAGLEYFWGVRNQASYPYNTAAHALRSVTGRWEMWPELAYTPQAAGPDDARIPATDPACAGYYAIETLPGNPVTGKKSALGKEMSARWGDRSIRGPGQQFASEMIQTAGIVIPPSAILAQGVGAARAAVTGQLQQQSAGVWIALRSRSLRNGRDIAFREAFPHGVKSVAELERSESQQAA